MTGQIDQRRLDQVFFGWSPRDGRLTVLAETFGRPDEHRRWLHRLQSRIRLQRVAGAAVPDAAVSYFRFPDGNAVLLRRVNTGVTSGRNNSHALIGPAELLTARTALGLSFWKGWRDDLAGTGPLEPLLVGEGRITEPAAEADRILYPKAAGATATLVRILAARLADPARPISVVGCPEDQKKAMIWALTEIAARTGLGPPEPTFSTYEDRHDDGVELAPHLLFLPARPYERAEVSRTVVDVEEPAPAGPYLESAQRLAQQLAGRTLGRPPQASPPSPPPITSPVAARRDPPPAASPTAEQRLAAGLCAARTPADVDRALADLERLPSGRRHLVRAALDPGTLEAAALRIETTFRQALLRLAEAAYGRDLQDLDDQQAQRHALEVVRTGASDELAVIIGGSVAAARTPIPAAAVKRWTGRPGEPGTGLWRRPRADGRGRYLPLVLAAALAGLLGAAFLGGLALGRGDDATARPPLPPPPVGRTAAVPGGGTAGGFTTIPGVDPERVTVVAFRPGPDARMRPLGPCVGGAGDLWFCPSRGDLPPQPNAELVAYAIDRKVAEDVLKTPDAQTPTPQWGEQHRVW
ncbi:hypothetical protein [Actinoplanes sp. NPDC049265]|uniref:hypothetical protein n=1 Tax=Actinoplanes sp. NPDC049265 TaxID=3363902 RepID=UPI00371D3BD7